MCQLIHQDKIGRCSEAAVCDYIRDFEYGQRTGNGEDHIQYYDRANGRQDNVTEPMPCVGTVNGCGFVLSFVYAGNCSDKQYHVLSHVPPDRRCHQHPVVDAGIFQPERQHVFRNSQQAQNGVQHESVGIEILENESHGNAADQTRKVQCSAEKVSAFWIKAENRCKQQCQCQLHNGTNHIIQAEFQGIEAIISCENVHIVLQSHKLSGTDIFHVVKAELHHFEKRQICKQYQQEQWYKQ